MHEQYLHGVHAHARLESGKIVLLSTPSRLYASTTTTQPYRIAAELSSDDRHPAHKASQVKIHDTISIRSTTRIQQNAAQDFRRGESAMS